MKLCHNCGQGVAEQIGICPTCGNEVAKGLAAVDDYRILEVVSEGHSSMVCRAVKEGDEEPVALRLFASGAGLDDALAQRLKNEFDELQKLPEEWFVRHYEIKQSSEGIWYRVSEWLEAESWGDLLGSGRLQDLDVLYDLFYRIAAILDGLHKSGHFIPHLILNDILVLKGDHGRVDVKIDYKLSRFLDPKMDHPGPMLRGLLECHPDITGNRPLNFKSDVWSLGRIFIQILAADLDLRDPVGEAQSGRFPKEISILTRSMLADDPALRPRSMFEVAEAVKRIKDESSPVTTSHGTATAREIVKLKKVVLIFGVIVGLITLVGGLYIFRFDRGPDTSQTPLSEYASRYAGSVAFVVVEYQIRVDDSVLYRQRTEGTAFLVDHDGYLLTNRHVACPWLEDEKVHSLVRYIREAEKNPRFDYRIFLWFEGDTAFNRLLGIGGGNELVDQYNLLTAYSRGGERDVTIAGVARPPLGIGQMIRAPLKNDFAVLKINKVPRGLKPLPLDKDLDVTKIKRLSPVIALGFPLGSSSQENDINVSVTRGHVRRTFENFFQVDTSIYRGNSGGPIIDGRGNVIGIASAVATDLAIAPLPVVTQLSDIGLVLPVGKAAEFIAELKAGQTKWNGVPDLDVAKKIEEITDVAFSGHWLRATDLADQHLAASNDPALIMVAAMMHYCVGDLVGAAVLFDRVLSIEVDNHQARLMRYLIDHRQVPGQMSFHFPLLFNFDWRSTGEFYGHLARIIQTGDFTESMLDSWNTPEEKSWIYCIIGMLERDARNTGRAEQLLKSAAETSDKDEWPLYLALSALDRMMHGQSGKTEELFEFRKRREREDAEREELKSRISLLVVAFEQAASDPATRKDILYQLSALQPENKKLLALISFYDAITSEWQKASEAAGRFLEQRGREEPLRLGTGLLLPGILYHIGKKGDADKQLELYRNRTDNPWYRQISQTLLDEWSVDDLMERAGKVPEKILTACVALGFKAEADGDYPLAAKYYREALGSYLDNWLEYELARQRYLMLRQGGKH